MRRGTAGIAAARRRAELRISDLQRAAGRLGGQAEQAVRAGQDDLARQALARRAAMLAQVSRLREQQATLPAEEELARLRGRLAQDAGQGHRTVPHTADLRLEAWGPTQEACLAEAVRGVVDSFAVVAAARPRHTAERRFIASSDEDLLVAVVEEVVYRLDADGEIPVTAAVRPAPEGGVVLTLALADVKEAEITGAAPKAASLHDLRCAVDATGRWSCGITIDVQQPAHRPGPTRGWPWRGR